MYEPDFSPYMRFSGARDFLREGFLQYTPVLRPPLAICCVRPHFQPIHAIRDFGRDHAIIFGNEHSKSLSNIIVKDFSDIHRFFVPKWCKNPAEQRKSPMFILVRARVFWPFVADMQQPPHRASSSPEILARARIYTNYI